MPIDYGRDLTGHHHRVLHSIKKNELRTVRLEGIFIKCCWRRKDAEDICNPIYLKQTDPPKILILFIRLYLKKFESYICIDLYGAQTQVAEQWIEDKTPYVASAYTYLHEHERYIHQAVTREVAVNWYGGVLALSCTLLFHLLLFCVLLIILNYTSLNLHLL